MQLDLLGMPVERPKNHCLFLAVMPDRLVAGEILEFALSLSGGRGKPRPTGHLHVSLHEIGHYEEAPAGVVARVAEACQKVAAKTESLEVTFDRVMPYGGGCLAMASGSLGNQPLRVMYQALGRELLLSGAVRSIDKSFSPHLTMLYGDHGVREKTILPFTWQAREIVLIDSWQGMTQYDIRGRWVLGGH